MGGVTPKAVWGTAGQAAGADADDSCRTSELSQLWLLVGLKGISGS